MAVRHIDRIETAQRLALASIRKFPHRASIAESHLRDALIHLVKLRMDDPGNPQLAELQSAQEDLRYLLRIIHDEGETT